MEIDSFTKNILNRVPDGAGIFTIVKCEDGTKTLGDFWLNDSYYDMLHTTREERFKRFKGNVIAIIYPDDLKTVIDAISVNEEKRNEYTNISIRILYGDDKYHWVKISTRYDKFEDDTFLVSFTDIDPIIGHHISANQNLIVENLVNNFGVQYWMYAPQYHHFEMLFQSTANGQIPLIMENFPQSWKKLDIVHPDDFDAFIELHKKVDAGQRDVSANIRMNIQGRYIWRKIHYIAINDNNGNIGQAFCVSRDITDELRYNRNFQNHGFVSVSNEKNIIARAAINLTQRKVTRCVSPFIKIYSENDDISSGCIFPTTVQYIDNEIKQAEFSNLFSFDCLLEKYNSGETSFSREYWITLKNKNPICVQIRVNFVKDLISQDTTALIYVLNVTRKKTREDISISLLEKSFDYVGYVDLNTNIYSVILLDKIYPNNQTSYNKKNDYYQYLSRSILKRVHEDDRSGCLASFNLENIKRHLEKEDVYTVVYRLNSRCNDIEGNPWRRVRMCLYYLNDKKNIIVFSRNDVTTVFEQEMKQKIALENALEESRAAEQAKTNFLSRMSHEIRTPLNAIIGLSDLGLKESRSAEKTEYFREIQVSGKYLLSIVDDVLDMSNIQSGKMELEEEDVQFSYIINAVETIIRPLAEQKKVNFESYTGTASNFIVRTDAKRLIQVCINLLNNAVKFTEENGTVSFIVKCGVETHGGIPFTISVSDTGCGINSDFIPQLFTKFSQEKNEYRVNSQGTGLGLAITKSIISMMGGSIDVQSQVGVGTTFTVAVVLPQVAKNVKAIRETDETVDRLPSLFGKRILVVEDNEINAEITIQLLENEGCKTELATNGKIALDMFENSASHYYDAIVMDILMPVMDGLEATKRIRAGNHPDSVSIPIIAATANAFRTDVQTALDAGVNSYVTKPFDPSKLFMAIRSVLPL